MRKWEQGNFAILLNFEWIRPEILEQIRQKETARPLPRSCKYNFYLLRFLQHRKHIFEIQSNSNQIKGGVNPSALLKSCI